MIKPDTQTTNLDLDSVMNTAPSEPMEANGINGPKCGKPATMPALFHLGAVASDRANSC
jgi:hypothetical protein